LPPLPFKKIILLLQWQLDDNVEDRDGGDDDIDDVDDDDRSGDGADFYHFPA